MARRDRARRLVQREERELEYGLFAHGAVLDLDAFLFEDSQDSFSDRLLISDDDPQAHLEAQELRGLIGGIEIDDVERMNDETVDWLRHKLASAGYMPGRITAEERERVAVKRKEYVPRRAESQGSRRMKDLLPEDVLPEARGHSKLMKIARQNQRSRKRRRMLAPPKAEA